MVVLKEVSSMFWGLTIESGKHYTQTVERSFHISMAALDPHHSKSGGGSNKNISLMIQHEKAEFVLCTLAHGGLYQQPLDLNFTEGEEVTFFTNGSGVIHLTGYLVEDQEEDEYPMGMMDEDMSDEDEDEDEDSEDESSDDEDDDEIPALVGPDGDMGDSDDDEDDEDFEIDEDEEDDDDEGEDKIADVQKLLKEAKKRKKKENTSSPVKKSKVEEKPSQPKAEVVETESKKKKKKKKKKNKESEQQQTDTSASGQPPKQQKQVLGGGVVSQELKEGHGPEAKAGKMVHVYYVGKLAKSGQQFDSCQSGKPFKFRLGKREVITGWDTGVSGMKVGGKRRLTIPPQQGYGNQRQGPIPPNSTLIFDVELKAFSNLLGSVYRKGNILFSQDGNRVFSPVGNRITVFDLKSNRSETLPIESQKNITCVALSPDGSVLILVNEDGEAYLCSMVSKTVLATYHFHQPVHQVKFSPDGRKFAVTRDTVVLVFHAPGHQREYNPFLLQRTFYGAYDINTCLDWTSDSRVFCVGSKDMNTRVYGAEHFSNLIVYSLGSHSDAIVGAFFAHNSLNLYSVSTNGHVCVWESDTPLSGLKPFVPKETKEKQDDEAIPQTEEETDSEVKERLQSKSKDQTEKVLYRKKAKHSFKEARGAGSAYAKITCATYHKPSSILVCGFQDGSFFLHEMPEFNMIHSLSISDQVLASVTFNPSGDWLALACSGLGQLLVWEWQSETYILKQQGHFNDMTCLAYSPDGLNIVTGGEDSKVKIWNTNSGFCFVTFSEHTGGITGVCFNHTGQVVVSSSLDGTVRAFDLNRYRNFRTFTSPNPVQFSCLAIDHSGEIVCAGGLDTFDIFVWSMQTGRLLEVLTGHTGPISCLAFSSDHALLASGSWDKSVKLWDVFQSKGAKESMDFVTDVLALTFRPDGQELAVSTLNAQVTFWDPNTCTQKGTIEGRHDLGYFRKDTDKITAKKSAGGKTFTTLSYSADGQCLLAAGKSKNVCIYSVRDQLLIKKFEISKNLSFDGMEEFLDRKKMTQWGNIDLVETSEEGARSLDLPGAKKRDMSSRHFKPEVRVSCIQFSPTGRAWAATTTEGVQVYSLDSALVFDPFQLEMEVTPQNIKKSIQRGDHSIALMLSFRLNEKPLIQEVVENIPISGVESLVEGLPEVYVDKLLNFLANQLESSAHLEFYLTFINRLLMCHGPKLQSRTPHLLAILRTLQKNLNLKKDDLSKICDHNKYSIDYLLSLAQAKRKMAARVAEERGQDVGQDSGIDNSSDDNTGDDGLDSEDENFMSQLMETAS